jgi:hypothetical protein
LLRTALRPEIDVDVFEVFSCEATEDREADAVACGFVTKPQGCVMDSVTAESLY